VIFKVRTYTPEDFETLYRIDQSCYEPEIAYTRPEMRKYLQLAGAECMVSEAGRGKITGFCLAAHEKQVGYIITMDVLQSYRRCGIATALLDEIEQRLTGQHVCEVWLDTATDNEAAIAFWQKRGYRKLGLRKGYYLGRCDAYAMRKIIDNPAQGGRKTQAAC
jgi:ribosomal-protein-alanine N-acetyltransferase